MTHSYQITGMTCNGCVAKVKSELLKLGAVTDATVALTSPQASLGMQSHIPLQVLQEAVHRAGNYAITEVAAEHTLSGAATTEDPPSYYPILLIFGFIAGVAALIQWPAFPVFSFTTWMRCFMAGFFLVFSFFKLLNLKGFAGGYRNYDMVARQLPVYGFIYPFLELLLGIAFLVNFQPLFTNIAALILMSISAVGVASSLLRGQVFQCACLGTIIKLPLSKVTLLEDVLMVMMSAAMLILMNA